MRYEDIIKKPCGCGTNGMGVIDPVTISLVSGIISSVSKNGKLFKELSKQGKYLRAEASELKSLINELRDIYAAKVQERNELLAVNGSMNGFAFLALLKKRKANREKINYTTAASSVQFLSEQAEKLANDIGAVQQEIDQLTAQINTKQVQEQEESEQNNKILLIGGGVLALVVLVAIIK